MALSLDSRRRSTNDDGFTLIELLMVIIILGVLAAIVVFSVRGINDKSEEAACKAEVHTVATAEESSKAQDGIYRTLAGLHTAGFLRGATPSETYVASASASDGSLTMAAGAPCAAG